MKTRADTLLWVTAILAGSFVVAAVLMHLIAQACWGEETLGDPGDAVFTFGVYIPAMLTWACWWISVPVFGTGIGLIVAGFTRPDRGRYALAGAGLIALVWIAAGFVWLGLWVFVPSGGI